ncbi:MAG: hypothetical protein IBJ03_06175 [Gemmatimonadaceae bacterium]|nr:hypothetical protein [Gemmatimonadaceae bacterium]
MRTASLSVELTAVPTTGRTDAARSHAVLQIAMDSIATAGAQRRTECIETYILAISEAVLRPIRLMRLVVRLEGEAAECAMVLTVIQEKYLSVRRVTTDATHFDAEWILGGSWQDHAEGGETRHRFW